MEYGHEPISTHYRKRQFPVWEQNNSRTVVSRKLIPLGQQTRETAS